MTYYVIRVAPRREEAFLRLSTQTLGDDRVSLVYPRRRLDQVKGGRKTSADVALFPGYVFLRSEGPMDPEIYRRIKDLPGYNHFLRQEGELSEVRGRDLDLLSHFLKFGDIAPVSQVVFDENHRIRVLSGPLEGLEGLVVHVDRRKHRAKVRMEFDRGTFTVTLGFSLMAGAPAPGGPL